MADPTLATSKNSDNRPTWPWILAPIGLILLGFISIGTIDHPLSAWFPKASIPGELRRLIHFGETPGHALGATVILLAVWVLDPLNRRKLPRLLACTYGSGLIATASKLLLGRARPRAFDFSQSIAESFTGWFPLGTGGSANQSFPSAHTATAVGLALALTWAYPRGRWFFVGLAVLVAVQRVYGSAHFASDTCFGAAIGCLVAAGVLRFGPVAGWFDRFEAKEKPSS